MLRTVRVPVKRRNARRRKAFAPRPLAVQTGRTPDPAAAVDLPVLLITVAAGLLLAWVALRRHRRARHQREMVHLLDAADALEAKLRTARSEITAVAGDRNGDPVQDAMREMLRQRLWLREHGGEASVGELRQVRDSIEDARRRIDHQLARVREARVSAA